MYSRAGVSVSEMSSTLFQRRRGRWFLVGATQIVTRIGGCVLCLDEVPPYQGCEALRSLEVGEMCRAANDLEPRLWNQGLGKVGFTGS